MELSILLITYNNESHIKETINSILIQNTDFEYEIVVGDDCSTDSTYSIIKEYMFKYPNRFNIKQNNQQLGILRNFKTTLDRCEGNYIFDIAGDDVLRSNTALQKIVDVFRKNRAIGFVDSGYDKLIDDTKKILPYTNKFTINADKNKYKEYVLLGKIIPVGVCYNKQALYKFVDFDYYINSEILFEDYPILVNLVMNTKFKTIDNSLSIYRIHEASFSNKKNLNDRLDRKNQMLNLFYHFRDKYNFHGSLVKKYEQTHYKSILHLAAEHNEKDLGINSYKKIETQRAIDVFHFLASQNKLIKYIYNLKKLKGKISIRVYQFLNSYNLRKNIYNKDFENKL